MTPKPSSWELTLARAVADATMASRTRDARIREAHAAGESMRAIARATGLSLTRISQIVNRL